MVLKLWPVPFVVAVVVVVNVLWSEAFPRSKLQRWCWTGLSHHQENQCLNYKTI